MTYTPEFLKKIVTLGTLGYNIQKIINILDIPDADHESFVADFNDLKSEVRTAFQKGVDKSDFSIDQKLFELAQSGDLKAIEKYDEHKLRNLTAVDSQEFELKSALVGQEKLKLQREREVDTMINEFLGLNGDS